MRGVMLAKDAGWEKITVGGEPRGWRPPRDGWGWTRLGARLLARAGWLALRGVGLLAGFVLTNPVLGPVLLVLAAFVVAGLRWAALGVTVAAGLGFTGWFVLRAEGFDRQVSCKLRAWVRRRRYRWRWADLMAAREAVVKDRRRRVLAPRLGRIRCGRFADVLTVKLPDGITTEEFSEHLPALTEAMRARDARIVARPPRRLPAWVRSRLAVEFAPPAQRPGVVRLRLAFGDPLTRIVTAASAVPAEQVDLGAVFVGVRDDGALWRLRLLGTHVLLAGATGAGKGSVLWAILASLGPAIQAGLVRVYGVDPKGGMELGFGRELFHRLVTVDGPGSETAVVEFLEELAAEADYRAAHLAGHTRQLSPTAAMPFLLIVLDELASITAFLADNKLRARAEAALGRLLTKGRAPGMCVLGALQDPRKDVIRYRDLFPTRVALRLVEAGQVDLILGDGARQRGARCERIPETSPGVGYVVEDGRAAVTRVRAAYLTDEDIRTLARTYRPAPVRAGDLDDGRVVTFPAPAAPSGTRREETTR